VIIAQGCFPVRPKMTLKQIVAQGQKLESQVLLKATKLYLDKRLDVHWGTVKEI
jgi:formyltetrahydrofolate hydrolase